MHTLQKGGSPAHIAPMLGVPSAQPRCWPGPGGWLESSSVHHRASPSTAAPRTSRPRPAHGREQGASGPGWAPRAWPRWVPGSPPRPSSGCLSPFLASFLPRLLPVLVAEPGAVGSPPIL